MNVSPINQPKQYLLEMLCADVFLRGACLSNDNDNKMTTEEQDEVIEIVRACFNSI